MILMKRYSFHTLTLKLLISMVLNTLYGFISASLFLPFIRLNPHTLVIVTVIMTLHYATRVTNYILPLVPDEDIYMYEFIRYDL